eukprot:COSAG01_NODE_7541_length_3158_cov_22.404707_2_plen_134_part_00
MPTALVAGGCREAAEHLRRDGAVILGGLRTKLSGAEAYADTARSLPRELFGARLLATAQPVSVGIPNKVRRRVPAGRRGRGCMMAAARAHTHPRQGMAAEPGSVAAAACARSLSRTPRRGRRSMRSTGARMWA